MDRKQTRRFVIEELGKHVNRDDVLAVVSRALDIDWQQAEDLVREVEQSNAREIAIRQSPILIVIGVGVIAGGLALTTYGVWYFIDLLQMNSMQQILYSQFIADIAGSMVLGLGMITGGIIGFRKVFSALLN
jgi:hypothetical protein